MKKVTVGLFGNPSYEPGDSSRLERCQMLLAQPRGASVGEGAAESPRLGKPRSCWGTRQILASSTQLPPLVAPVREFRGPDGHAVGVWAGALAGGPALGPKACNFEA